MVNVQIIELSATPKPNKPINKSVCNNIRPHHHQPYITNIKSNFDKQMTLENCKTRDGKEIKENKDQK